MSPHLQSSYFIVDTDTSSVVDVVKLPIALALRLGANKEPHWSLTNVPFQSSAFLDAAPGKLSSMVLSQLDCSKESDMIKMVATVIIMPTLVSEKEKRKICIQLENIGPKNSMQY
jgi:hypothetical protein